MFFETLARALNRRLSKNKEIIGKALNDYGAVLTSTIKAAGSAAESAAGSPISGIGDAAESITSLGALWSATSLDELRTRVDEILSKEKTRIVVLMDDIDRLDKVEIQTILRLIKLTADFKYTAYVLAFDHDMVAAAVGERYSGDRRKSVSAGTSFLEKIIQVPLNLPPIPKSSLLSFCNECIDEALRESKIDLTAEDARVFVMNFQSAVADRLSTPRMAKRYANALAFSMAILRNEVHPGDLMLLEAMRVFYPEVYAEVRKNKDLMLGKGFYADAHNGKGIGDTVTQLISTVTKEQREQAKDLINALFPRTTGVIYDQEWDGQWTEQKRAASSYYFDRYFTYAIAATDIADTRIQDFIAGAAELPLADYGRFFRTLINDKNASTLIAKLRLSENKVNSSTAHAIAMALSLNADAFPNQRSSPFTAALEQAAILVSQLLRRIPGEPERLKVCLEVFEQCPSVVFICEVFRWCYSSHNKDEQSAMFSPDSEVLLKKKLSFRIVNHLRDTPEPFFVIEPENSLTYLQFGHAFGAANEIREYLQNQLAAEPSSVTALLSAVLGKSWDLTSGLPTDTPFMMENFKFLSKLVDTRFIVEAIHKRYGADLDHPTPTSQANRDRDRQHAAQFMKFVSQRHDKAATVPQDDPPRDEAGSNDDKGEIPDVNGGAN